MLLRMMFDRFSETTRQVIRLARRDAERAHHDSVGPEHLLYALLRHNHGIALAVLERLGVHRDAMLDDLRHARRDILSSKAGDEIPFDKQALEVLERTIGEARRLGDHFVGTEHLLLGLAMIESVAAVRLREQGASAAAVLREVASLVSRRNDVER